MSTPPRAFFRVMLLIACGIAPLAGSREPASASPAQPVTALGALAAQMQPGTWAELNTTVGFQGDLLRVDSSSDYITQYADSGAWDPVGRRFLFVGQAHGNGSGARFIIYTEGDNTWRKGPLPLSCMGEPNSSCIGHAYDHNTVDPATGDLYYRHYYGLELHRYSAATGLWTQLASAPEAVIRLFGSYGSGVNYIPELAGVVVIAGSFGEVALYNPATDQWSQIATGLSVTPGCFAQYNPVHKVMIFGGIGTSDLYKLDASGTVTKMQNAPISLGVTLTVVSVDPVSGKYLVLHNSGFYEYDVTTDAWSLIAGQIPSFLPSVSDGLIEAPITTYGVVMYLKYNGSSKVFLYKHSPGGGGPLPQAPPSITTQPSNQTVAQGQTATFSVTATGTAPLSYQWRRNGTDIVGATSSSYTTPPTTTTDNGATFQIVVSNSAGSVTSNPATLTVTPIVDSDGDGLPDAWELQYFGSLSQTASGDPEGDGLSNFQEQAAGTNPLVADTDGDGMTDGSEVGFGFDPLNPDQDQNGLPDGQDDWDADGIPNQSDQTPGILPGPSGNRAGGGGGCGTTGMEVVWCLGLFHLLRSLGRRALHLSSLTWPQHGISSGASCRTRPF